MYRYTQSAFSVMVLTHTYTQTGLLMNTHVRTHLLKQEILTGKTI